MSTDAVNIIDRSYAVRGKQVRLRELADVVAVKFDDAATKRRAGAKNSNSKGEARIEQIAPDSAPQVRAFESAGWTFVPRRQATDGAKVYVKSGGRIALGTNRLTVRVGGARSEAEAQDVLANHGVTVIDRLKMAPNLYTVSVPRGRDPVEAAERLLASGEVEFAEPELIEIISGR